MSEIVSREVKRWSETLAELNEYDITLVNILLKHCEDLIIGFLIFLAFFEVVYSKACESRGVWIKVWKLKRIGY